ncbi:MAG: 2-oxo acid dehydrogenase subunit E2, partial [Propionibacteriaceae bacterium]|nr:2-oxo acid dehydrogenase subunit E2 [Propionibacteriaceae bacterium]
MAEIVVMPQLGNTVETCLVTAWHVGVGDEVGPATIVADIETDKSTMEIPAGIGGTILALLAGPGDEVPVKAPFFIVGTPGEDIDG